MALPTSLNTRKYRNFQKEDEALTETNPVLVTIGGVYRSTLPTYSDGDTAMLHFSSDGRLKVDTELSINGDLNVDNVEANPEYKGYKSYEGTLSADVELDILTDLGASGRTGYIYNASDSDLEVQIYSDGAYGDSIKIPTYSTFEIGGLKTDKIKLIYNGSSTQNYGVFVAKAEWFRWLD